MKGGERWVKGHSTPFTHRPPDKQGFSAQKVKGEGYFIFLFAQKNTDNGGGSTPSQGGNTTGGSNSAGGELRRHGIKGKKIGSVSQQALSHTY